MIASLSEDHQKRVVEQLKQLLHCDKKSSFPLINKSILLEVYAAFHQLEGEWLNMDIFGQELLNREIAETVKSVKKVTPHEVIFVVSVEIKNDKECASIKKCQR